MPLPPLPDTAISLGVRASDWRDAVRLAGEALSRSGATRAQYTDRMLRLIDDYGAYIVIAPGLALAHARPGPDVRSDGLSVVTLSNPVIFGHPHNDPVSIVIGLAVATPDAHVTTIAALANVFNDPQATTRLAAATDPDEVRSIFAVDERETQPDGVVG
ncbi:MAG: PTS sugar transporter subunit IIA [Microbacteriaceae bacterium]|nr:MAG: PTS sugar transporter subunit IIA [Microbacteriaceae bacterium]